MKIILLSDVKKIGRRHEIKEVSNGHAQNFLFPKKLAIPASEENLARHHLLVKAENEKINHLRTIAKKLEKEVLTFTITTGKNGEIFSSITKEDIKKAIATYHSLEVKDIELNIPIKKLGAHTVLANLGKGVYANISLIAQSIRPLH